MIEAIIWWLLLLDSLFSNVLAFFFPKWYEKKYKRLSKILPIKKAWTILYLVLVLWIGWLLARLNLF